MKDIQKHVEVLKEMLEDYTGCRNGIVIKGEKHYALCHAISAIKENKELKQKLASIRQEIEKELPEKKDHIVYLTKKELENNSGLGSRTVEGWIKYGHNTAIGAVHEALDRVLPKGEVK